jgi:hypothetical protein
MRQFMQGGEAFPIGGEAAVHHYHWDLPRPARQAVEHEALELVFGAADFPGLVGALEVFEVARTV